MKIIQKAIPSITLLVIIMLITAPGSIADNKRTEILILGDSLISGYGLLPEETFAAKLQNKLAKEKYNTVVTNSTIYGNTSAGIKASIKSIIEAKPNMIILAVGYNDIYKGIFPDQTHNNLEKVVRKLTQADIKVLICGMKSPPKMSENFSKSFDTLFKDISDAYNTGYYPFFMEWVKDDNLKRQTDGIHPNAAGIDALLKGIFPEIKYLIDGKRV